jgi:hypothetical protein
MSARNDWGLARFVRQGGALLLALLLILPALGPSESLAKKEPTPPAKSPKIFCCTLTEIPTFAAHTHLAGSRLFYQPGATLKFSLFVEVSKDPYVTDVTFPRIFTQGEPVRGQLRKGNWSYSYTVKTATSAKKPSGEFEIRAEAENGKAKGTLLSVIPDSLDPEIDITSPHSSYETTGKVQINVDAVDPQVGKVMPSGIARVEFWAYPPGGSDFAKIGEDTNAPYSLVWDPPTGSNVVVVKAIDNVGNWQSDSIELCGDSCGSGNPPPNNDEKSGATVVPGVPFDSVVSIFDATSNASDPVCSVPDPDNNGAFINLQYGHSVWYRFTPTAGGDYTFSTEGSIEDATDPENSLELDTVLGVYSSSGTLMGCNDDDEDLYTSLFEIGIAPNQTVYVMVGVRNDADISEDSLLGFMVDQR